MRTSVIRAIGRSLRLAVRRTASAVGAPWRQQFFLLSMLTQECSRCGTVKTPVVLRTDAATGAAVPANCVVCPDGRWNDEDSEKTRKAGERHVALWRGYGGESGIRTHGGIATTPVFKTGALNRSAISPYSAAFRRHGDRRRRFDSGHRALRPAGQCRCTALFALLLQRSQDRCLEPLGHLSVFLPRFVVMETGDAGLTPGILRCALGASAVARHCSRGSFSAVKPVSGRLRGRPAAGRVGAWAIAGFLPP